MMLWLKAFHIIAIVAWFAGLFYLPRLFVYHSNLNSNEPHYTLFCTMERRLYWGIMMPSALISLVLGIGVVHTMGLSLSHPPMWLAYKLALVMLLLLYHGYCGKLIFTFKHRQNQHSSRFYRWFNEIPTLLLVGIVLLVVLKPY